VDGARRKRQRGMGLKAGDFVSGTGTAADGGAMAIQSLEHTDGLEKVETIALGEEGIGYRSVCSPALGGHRFRGSGRCLVVATICVNEFSDV